MKIKTTLITESLFTKIGGIISSGVIYDIPNIIRANRKLYYYKWDMRDLIEINLEENHITVHEFTYTELDAFEAIKQNADALYSYFVAAGLLGKRFLYDTSFKLAVSTSDFMATDKPFQGKNEVAFITSRPKEKRYIVTNDKVTIFEHLWKDMIINNSLLTLYNSVNSIIKPLKEISQDGALFTLVLSGLQGGVKWNEPTEKDDGNLMRDFLKNRIDISCLPDNLKIDYSEGIKKDKLFSLMYSVYDEEKESIGEKVNVTRLIDMGLDRFTRLLGHNKKIEVVMDFPFDVKEMWIMGGVAYIVPTATSDLEKIEEQLNSSNIVSVFTS